MTVARSLSGRWSGWPSLAGAALAVGIAVDTSNGRELAAVLAAAGLVYLGSAVLQRPKAAWPLFGFTFVVIAATRIGAISFDATWVFLAIAVTLIVYGMVPSRRSRISGLSLQVSAMLACGAAAAIALFLDQTSGAYVVAGGLLAHAAWDVYHFWRGTVVVRTMAEFCGVLDALLALVILVAAARS